MLFVHLNPVPIFTKYLATLGMHFHLSTFLAFKHPFIGMFLCREHRTNAQCRNTHRQ